MNEVEAREVDVADVLRAIAAVGPYFEVVTDPVGPTWLPLAALAGPVLDERVSHVQGVLAGRTGLAVADIDRRACASTNFLGIVSRLVAPALGAAALTGNALTPQAVFWQQGDGGPIPIAWPDVTARPVDSTAAAADVVATEVIDRLVRPLVDAYRAGCGLSPHVLWGNVASALAGAAGMVASAGATRLDPVAIVSALLGRADLGGMGEYLQPDRSRAERFFVRNNCCLFYRIPGGGTCGDCVLVPRAEREVMWRDVLDRSR